VRIIGGSLSGRAIPMPRGANIRPTTDMAREALFNILSHRFDLETLRVLDLFSGTGAVAFEFTSRGCRDVTAIEQNPGAVRSIYQQVDAWKIEGLKIIRTDVFRFLEKGAGPPWDLVFADPPFNHPYLGHIPELVIGSGILGPAAVFVLEHPPGPDFSQHPAFKEMRRYGHVHFSFFQQA